MSAKRILHFGLTGPPNAQMAASGLTATAVQEQVNAGAERARAAGYDVQLTFFAPEEFEVALAAVQTELQTGGWDALVIGGGVRMAAPLTAQFERAVEAGIAVVRSGRAPGLKVLFQAAPGDMLETVQRGFGGGEVVV